MRTLHQLVPWLRPWGSQLLLEAAAHRWPVQVASVRRTHALQAKLYRDYLAGRSRYPAAPPGHSMHEIGRAFDLRASDAILERLGAIWESWGGTWGGRGEDPIHFEA